MMNIQFHSSFRKAFQKQSKQVQDAFEMRIELFMQDPYHSVLRNHAVGRAYPGCRSVNVTGDVRALYRVREGAVIFVLIGTHAQLY